MDLCGGPGKERDTGIQGRKIWIAWQAMAVAVGSTITAVAGLYKRSKSLEGMQVTDQQ